MSCSIKSPAVLGFILATPLLAAPALSALAPKTMPGPEHYRATNFAKPQALVSPATPALSTRETDGLGGNDSECNRGCVDH
jgi:hypothetical protein